MAAYVDTHCHLDLFPGIRQDPFRENTSDIKSITVTNAPYLYEPNQRLFAGCEHIRVALGFHPEALGDPRLLAQYRQQLTLFDALIPEARYVGEVGLDGSSAWKSTWQTQLTVLKHIAGRCENIGGKILTVHSRRAVEGVLSLLGSERMKNNGNKIIMHWFSGSLLDLERAKAGGTYFSVNNKMLHSASGQRLIAQMPLDKVLTETDAPFTFSEDNEKRYDQLSNTLDKLARIWQMTTEEAKDIVYSNFRRLLST